MSNGTSPKSKTNPNPPPATSSKKVRDARTGGHKNFIRLQNYIAECRDEEKRPTPRGFLESLLPRASMAGIIRAAMLWDAVAEDPDAYRPRPYTGAVFPIMT